MDVGISVLLMALGAWALAAFSAWRCRELYRSGNAYWSGQVMGKRTGFPVWFRVTLGVIGAIGCVFAVAAAYFTVQLPQAFSAQYHRGAKGGQGLDLASTLLIRAPHTLREVFQQDFDHTRRANKDVTVTPVRGGAPMTVHGRLYVDVDSMAKFIGFFVPLSVESPAVLIATLADHVEQILSVNGPVPIDGGGLGGQQTDSANVTFSGKVYVYHEGLLSVRERATLHDVYRRKGLSLELRGADSVPAVAQSQAFEVISIKPARSGDARHMRMRVLPNGDLNASAVPVLLLLRYAYDVPVNTSVRLSGLPGWPETYDIEAKAPANAVPPGLPASEKRGRIQGMIRRLLADCFKLVMRAEQKTMPVYALSVARGGPYLQKSTIAEKDCIFDTGTPESCHSFVMGRGHPLNAKAVTMDDLAQYIENWTDLPVVNRTALSGLFAVETEGWTPLRLPPPPPGNPPAARFDDLPTLFTVLRTLGLDLKQQEATVPVYTVEHIERPTGD